MSRIRVTPLVDHPVPKRDGSPLDPTGEILAKDRWWDRRARDGDVSVEPAETPGSKPVKRPVKSGAKED